MINKQLFEADVKNEMKSTFIKGLPFPHLVIDNFLEEHVALLLNKEFPPIERLNKAYRGINERKSEGASFDEYHTVFSDLKTELSSAAFAGYLSEVTGKKDLFVTPDNLGCGLHQGRNGSFLDVHVDFNIHPRLNVYRQINLLIYLEKDWQESYHGHLELWNKDMSNCEQRIMPVFNRCVIFECSEHSYHGYSQKLVLPEGVTRKSFYTYFYTSEIPSDIRYHDTIFRSRPDETVKKKVLTRSKEVLKNSIKANLKRMGISW